MTDLRRLLDPDTIAIVGLSDDPTKHGGRVLSSLRKLGYQGSIWGVNPRLPTVEGVEMVASLLELPTAPDVVACAIPSGAVPEIVSEAGAVGAGTVVVFAGGFAEAGGAGHEAQQAMINAARSSDVRILGPNSGGVIRPSARLAVSFLTCLDRPADEVRAGPVGLVTQSGGTGSYLHNLAAERGSGLGVSISTGNEADLGLADGINALTGMDEIKVIALVLETVRDGPAFIAAVEGAMNMGKPVVACRIGTSERGRSMTVTHTGAIARPAYVLDGVLHSLGVTLTETPAELLDVAEVMARAKIPAGGDVGVVTHSGGIAILLTDLAERHGIELPPPEAQLQAKLDALLDHGVATNPIDMGGIIGGPGRFGEVVDAFAESGEFDLILAVSTAHPRSHTVERVKGMLASQSGDHVVHLWMAGDVGAEGLELLREAGRPVTDEPRAALRALAGMIGFASARVAPGRPPASQPDRVSNGAVLSEHFAKEVMARWGLAVPEGGLAKSADDAAEIAERLGGPVVIKISSADLSHKTEVGGVRLGIEGGEASRDAFNNVTTNAQAAQPDATIEGVRVERHRSGLEVFVGGTEDPVFGPIMVVGLGGVAVEGLGSAIALAPLDRMGAQRLIGRAPGLAGALSRNSLDAAPRLAKVLTDLSSHFVEEDVSEFEVNPLAWTGEQWEALDALVILSDETSDEASTADRQRRKEKD